MKTLNYVVAFVVVLFVAFVGSVVPADAQNLAQCVQIEDVPDRDTVFSFTNVCNDPIWVSWTHDGTYTPNGAELANWDERYRYGAHLLPGETQAYHMYHNPERGVNYLYCVEPGQIADIRNVCQNPREHERERLAYERRREEEARERLAAERRREEEAREAERREAERREAERERLAAERRDATHCIEFEWDPEKWTDLGDIGTRFSNKPNTYGFRNTCTFVITVYHTNNDNRFLRLDLHSPYRSSALDDSIGVRGDDWDLAWFDGGGHEDAFSYVPFLLGPGVATGGINYNIRTGPAHPGFSGRLWLAVREPVDGGDAQVIFCADAADGEQTCLNETPREIELIR